MHQKERKELTILLKTMKEADWDMDEQDRDVSKGANQFVPRNENDEFEAMRKKEVFLML